MRVYDTAILRRWARRVWLAIQSRAIILVYHRVANISSDPQLLSVTPEHFAQHLQHVRQHYHPINLQALGQALVQGHIHHKAVVITFDDGYADNFWNALPLLEKYEIPATVFVSTGYVGQNREFWWDELERLILSSKVLPNSLELTINHKVHFWHLENPEKHFDMNSQSAREWNVTMGFYPTLRHKVYKELHHLLLPLNDAERQDILTQIARWAGALSVARQDYLALNSNELKSLAKGGLLEIGSHTITHSMLSAQSYEQQQWEITESKRNLESALGLPIVSFGYPYGNQEAAGREAPQLVHKAGYKLACANFPAPVTQKSDAFWLPRYLVRDWHEKSFSWRIKEWFRG